MRSTVWIPCKARSVGLPGKNKQPIGGLPLFEHTLIKALKLFDAENIYIDSDDQEILTKAADYGCKVHCRTAAMTSDATTLDDAALYFVDANNIIDQELLLTLQVTSPLLSTDAIDATISGVTLWGNDSALTVCHDRKLRWREIDGMTVPLYTERVNRQYAQQEYVETGGAVACTVGGLRKYRTRIHGSVKLIVVDKAQGIDIDTADDLAKAQTLFDCGHRESVDAYCNRLYKDSSGCWHGCGEDTPTKR